MKSKTYEEFIDKFKTKKTTDDCYTPQVVYDAVKAWVCKEYGINEKNIIRPFWPGANYKEAEYPDGCVVLDNPPFSILTEICSYYIDRGIHFFLFAPTLTNFSSKKNWNLMCHIICDGNVIYENGANVKTPFVNIAKIRIPGTLGDTCHNAENGKKWGTF